MMNIYVQQSIQINILRINSVMNSSVLQIGTAGIIKSRTDVANTGGFVKPAPEHDYEGFTTTSPSEGITIPLHAGGVR